MDHQDAWLQRGLLENIKKKTVTQTVEMYDQTLRRNLLFLLSLR